MRPALSLSIAEFVKRGAGVGVALRKPEEKKRNLTEPSLFTFGEEVAWGPWGLRGFSLTARTKEERKLIQCGVSGCDEFREQRGHYCSVLPPASERRTLRHPEYADASTWNEYNGLCLVRDWGVRGGG